MPLYHLNTTALIIIEYVYKTKICMFLYIYVLIDWAVVILQIYYFTIGHYHRVQLFVTKYRIRSDPNNLERGYLFYFFLISVETEAL